MQDDEQHWRPEASHLVDDLTLWLKIWKKNVTRSIFCRNQVYFTLLLLYNYKKHKRIVTKTHKRQRFEVEKRAEKFKVNQEEPKAKKFVSNLFPLAVNDTVNIT